MEFLETAYIEKYRFANVLCRKYHLRNRDSLEWNQRVGYFPQASSSATTHKPPQFVEDRNVRLSFAFRSRFLGSCAPNPWEQPLLALPYGPDRPGIPRKQSSPRGRCPPRLPHSVRYLGRVLGSR